MRLKNPKSLGSLLGAWWLFQSSRLLAATNLISADEIPQLRPPRAELPLTLWEQYGAWIIVLAILLVVLLAVCIWLALQTKPAPPMPPAIQARHDLEPLRQQPEDGVVLSRVSQVLRHYFSAAFPLPPGELTTTEFCRALTEAPQVGPDLAGPVGNFLRQCDQRKFAPLPPQSPLGAADTAAAFIDQAETRRAASAPEPPHAKANNSASGGSA